MGRTVRVGVTGASGLIGRTLRDELAERGDQVVTFVRTSSSTSSGDTIRWDPHAGEVDEADLRRAGALDALVHLSGAGIGDRRWSESRKREIVESRVRSTDVLCRVLAESGHDVAFLASASAVGWYGPRGDDVLDEVAAPGAGFLAELCQHWEQATDPLAQRGVPVAHLRSGVVVSTRGGLLRSQLPLFRLGLGGRLGPGTQWVSPISLLDEVRAILWIIDHRVVGPVNLCAPTPLTNRDFTKELARRIHRPALMRVPSFALTVALGTEMAFELALTSQRVVPRVLETAGFEFKHPDFASALEWAQTTGN